MLLLAAIANNPGHGYAIAGRLKELSSGALNLAEGTMYPALHRLEKKGYLISEWEAGQGKPRRIYRITLRGRQLLASQKKTWSAVQRSIKLVLQATQGA